MRDLTWLRALFSQKLKSKNLFGRPSKSQISFPKMFWTPELFGKSFDFLLECPTHFSECQNKFWMPKPSFESPNCITSPGFQRLCLPGVLAGCFGPLEIAASTSDRSTMSSVGIPLAETKKPLEIFFDEGWGWGGPKTIYNML